MTDPKFKSIFERMNAEQMKRDMAAQRAISIAAIAVATLLLILTGIANHDLTDPNRDALACHVEECE